MGTITGYSKPFLMTSRLINNMAVIKLGDKYSSDESPAWQLFNSVTGEPLCRATICLAPNASPKQGHVFIKNYAENEGVYQGLVKAGIVGEPYDLQDAGYAQGGVVHCPIIDEEFM